MIINKKLMALLLSTFITGAAVAATDGDLGESSTGTSVITMTVEKFGDGNKDGAVLIQGLENLDLGTFGINSELTKPSQFCIYATGYSAGERYEDITVKIGFTQVL